MSPFRELEQKMEYYVPNLPDDVCRCHDQTGLCGRNNECRRWLQRGSGGVRVRQAASLLHLDSLGECINFMDTKLVPVVIDGKRYEPCITTNPAIPDK
jgi:hypothetical protein